MVGCPVRQFFGCLQRVIGHALPHLCQKAAFKASGAHSLSQGLQRVIAELSVCVPNGMGRFACGFAFGDLVGHAAQVFNQHHSQGGRQGPQLTERQLVDLLVGIQKGGEQQRVQHAVGMRHIGPDDAIDTRQAFELLVCQFGQVGVVAAWNAVMNLLKLRLYQVKVVEQPLCGRRDVLATVRDGGHVVVRLAQRRNVFLHPREERRPTHMEGLFTHRLRCSQTAPVLFKALRAK